MINLRAVRHALPLLLLAATAASAAPLTDVYTVNNATWLARIAQTGYETFTGYAINNSTWGLTSTAGFSLSSLDNNSPEMFYQYTNPGGLGSVIIGTPYTPSQPRLRITFAGSNITALGMSLGLWAGTGTLNIATSAGDTTSLAVPTSGTLSFLGFTTAAPMSWVEIYNSNAQLLLDNVSLGTANSTVITPPPPVTETPEASSFFLCLGGLLAVFSKLRRTPQAFDQKS